MMIELNPNYGDGCQPPRAIKPGLSGIFFINTSGDMVSMADYCRLNVTPFKLKSKCGEGLKAPEIKQICKESGTKGFSGLNKEELIKLCCMPTQKELEKRWEENGFPKINTLLSGSEDSGLIEVKDGEFSIDAYDQHEFIDAEPKSERDYKTGKWEEYTKGWDGILTYRMENLFGFLGSLMAEGEKSSVTIRCENDSTDCWEKDVYKLSKVDGKFEHKHAKSDSYCPDDDYDDDDDD